MTDIDLESIGDCIKVRFFKSSFFGGLTFTYIYMRKDGTLIEAAQ